METPLDTSFTVHLKPITFCKYQLAVLNKRVLLSFPQLLDLRNQVNQLTLPETLEDIIETDNFVLLFVADKQHLIYLDIALLLDLRRQTDVLFRNFYPVLV
jgi:hypothetical protein